MADIPEDARNELTADEAKAIRSLHRLSRKWPQTLTLMSMGGGLCVVHSGDERLGMFSNVDRAEAVLDSFIGIPNDGGDW